MAASPVIQMRTSVLLFDYPIVTHWSNAVIADGDRGRIPDLPVDGLEFSGILRTPSSLSLIVSAAQRFPIGCWVGLQMNGQSRPARVADCTPHEDRYLLWLELNAAPAMPEPTQIM